MRSSHLINSICLPILAFALSACAASWHSNTQDAQPVGPSANPPSPSPEQPARNPQTSTPDQQPGTPNGPQTPSQNPDGSNGPNQGPQGPDQNQGPGQQQPNANQPLVDVRTCDSRTLEVDVLAGATARQSEDSVTAILAKYPELHSEQIAKQPYGVAFEVIVGLALDCQDAQCADEDGWNKIQLDLRTVPGVYFRCADAANDGGNSGGNPGGNPSDKPKQDHPGHRPHSPIVKLYDESR